METSYATSGDPPPAEIDVGALAEKIPSPLFFVAGAIAGGLVALAIAAGSEPARPLEARTPAVTAVDAARTLMLLRSVSTPTRAARAEEPAVEPAPAPRPKVQAHKPRASRPVRRAHR